MFFENVAANLASTFIWFLFTAAFSSAVLFRRILAFYNRGSKRICKEPRNSFPVSRQSQWVRYPLSACEEDERIFR